MARRLLIPKIRISMSMILLLNKEIRLSFDASEKIYNGYSSWVYMEEILGRPSRYAAFWWSPDGNKIAYLRTDETDVPVFTLNRLDEADGIHGMIEAGSLSQSQEIRIQRLKWELPILLQQKQYG